MKFRQTGRTIPPSGGTDGKYMLHGFLLLSGAEREQLIRRDGWDGTDIELQFVSVSPDEVTDEVS